LNKNSVNASLFTGTIVIICTLITFFVGFSGSDNQTIDYLALVFILLSEISLFGGLAYLFSYERAMNKLIIRSGIITTLIIYWIANIVMDMVLRGLFKDNINAFITINIIIIAGVSIIITGLLLAASKVEDSNKKVMDSKICMNVNENIIFSLKTDNKLCSYHDGLNKVYEELKYSDKVSFTIDKDRELNEKILNLQDELRNSDNTLVDEQEFNMRVEEILFLIKERNNLLLQMKRGNY